MKNFAIRLLLFRLCRARRSGICDEFQIEYVPKV